MAEEPQKTTRRSMTEQVRAFATNPWVAVAGLVATIISVPLAIYFGVASFASPDLAYVVSPARAVVVKQGTASHLSVQYGGRPIEGDVSAAQIAIWNAGKHPVRREGILRPISIRTDPRSPILEASIRKTSRDVIRLDLSRESETELRLSWNVLEQNDGGVIQVVYAGQPDARFSVDGVIEGQNAIRREGITEPEKNWIVRGIAYFLMAAVLVAGAAAINGLAGAYRELRERRPITKWRRVPMTIVLALFVAAMQYALWRFKSGEPPFGF